MNIKKYDYDYGTGDAEVTFKVNFDIFTKDKAVLLLDFFGWDYEEETVIDDLMKKYAIKAIEVSTANNYNEFGVKRWFKEQEGFLELDGSQGIELIHVAGYEFDDYLLDLSIT